MQPFPTVIPRPGVLRCWAVTTLWAVATLWAASTFSAGQLWAQTTAEPGQAKELSRFAGVETPVTGRRQIFGMVIEQRKYSLRVASGEEDLEIALPDGVPIDQRLDKPRLDLESHLLTQELPASQAEGAEFGKPVEFQLSLPHPGTGCRVLTSQRAPPPPLGQPQAIDSLSAAPPGSSACQTRYRPAARWRGQGGRFLRASEADRRQGRAACRTGQP